MCLQHTINEWWVSHALSLPLLLLLSSSLTNEGAVVMIAYDVSHSVIVLETTKLTQELAVKLEQGETFVSGTQWQTEK